MSVQVENPTNRLTINPLKYLNNLPEFCGDSGDLQTFTTLIDRIHPHLQTYDELSQLLFSDVIKSKLKGKARQAIEINCHATSWTEIKNILQNNFGDRRSCEELFDELRSVTFRTNTLDFYNDMKTKLHKLNNKLVVILGETEATRQSAMNNKRTALNIFKNKIPEPMKSILFCRNPEDLEQAMDILFQAGYAHVGNNNGTDLELKTHSSNRYNNYRNNTQYDKKDNRNRTKYGNPQQPFNRKNFQPMPQNNGRNYQQPQPYQSFQQHQPHRQPVQQHQPYQQHQQYHQLYQQHQPYQQPFQQHRPYQQPFQQHRPYQQANSQNPQNPPSQRPNTRNQLEPMDIGKIEVAENFQESASRINYHL